MNVPVVKKDANLVLRDIRKKKHLTLAELGHSMNLRSGQALANIEYGTNKLTLEKAFLAANALGVSVNVFLQAKVKQYEQNWRCQNEANNKRCFNQCTTSLFPGDTPGFA